MSTKPSPSLERITGATKFYSHDKGFGFVRTGSIYYHHHIIIWISITDLSQKSPHIFCIHGLADPILHLALQRTDCGVNVSELPLITIGHDRAQATRSPATFGLGHPSEPCFILKHQARSLALCGRVLEALGDHRLEFFFQTSCASKSALGCMESGATLRHPCRANRR